ncbi:hypothetical protein SSP35_18_00020 [Streptomyces sp. NBRC 110611]|uniref:hypothetical protein n=1 Tax=Streptomyces sp. NBRC 110611 TaxID=1621259 RepID=UPI00083756AA|nr:hypothetical protein [Streptomyces sp. NBRC 110611]GAU70274.1 hypothetical protein SSP35_18_00020 [Streptomyces sp. NBRC 110611]
MRRLTGLDPARLTPPQPVQAAAESHVEIAWRDGKPLPLTVVRPGIAVCPDPDVLDIREATSNPEPGLELDAEDYVAQIDFLLRRIESPEAGKRLVEFLGQAQPLPDADGGAVALEWIDGLVLRQNGRRISPSPAEVRAERVAFDHHARAVVRAGGRDADALTALRSAATTWQQRRRVRGVTEVAIARDLGFRHRIAYVALTRVERVHHLAVPRKRIPHHLFAGASSFVYRCDISSLNAPAAFLSTVDRAAAFQVWDHRDKIGDARLEQGYLVEQRACHRSPGRPAETSRPHWVSPDSVPEELRKQARVLVNRARSGTSASGKSPLETITDVTPGQAVGRAEPHKGEVGFVAMVPAKVDGYQDLLTLARRYRDEATATKQGCALVIGLNEGYPYRESEAGRKDRVKRQKKIIKDFADAWQKEKPGFPVAVLSFLWRAPHDSKGLSDQKTIPYGAIRQTIAGSDHVQEFAKALYADGKGYERIYFHTGDDPRVDIATAMDRDVRVAMADVDPRTVYFPEPNTFIKLLDGLTGLENGVTFGLGDQEGEALAKSLGKVRGEDRNNRVFAPDCSVVTDGGRLIKAILATPQQASSAHASSRSASPTPRATRAVKSGGSASSTSTGWRLTRQWGCRISSSKCRTTPGWQSSPEWTRRHSTNTSPEKGSRSS